jgi:predicted nucleotidyltransferase
MDEIFKNSAYSILELFIEHPSKDYSVRGIARELKINHATVINYISSLLKLGVIKKKNETLYPTYYADTEKQKYRQYKRNHIIFKITESGLIDNLKEKTLASAIILFGSCAKGSYTETSDIDLFIESKEQKIESKKYEKQLKRKINMLFEPNINNLSSELRNNIINGIILAGFIKIKE